MYLIDTHTHIYLPEFDDDRDQMMKRAEEAGVGLMILPAIDSATHEKMLELEARFPVCRAMIGLHPCSVTQDFEHELDLIGQYLEKRSFLAIGEIGLDFYWDKTFVREQYKAFHHQIMLALDRNLPIVIHSRSAIDECIGVVQEYPGLRGVFHCFSGNQEQAEAILETGFYLGVGGVVTFKNAGLDKVLGQTGLNRVVLETDAPYLAPMPFRGKRNEPAYLKYVLEKLSQVSGKGMEEIAELTSENARKLFGL